MNISEYYNWAMYICDISNLVIMQAPKLDPFT